MQYAIEDNQLSVYTVRIQGRIDAPAAPQLKDVLRTMTREGKKYFVLDLRRVSFIDSTGLGLLSSILRASRASGGDVCLVVMPGSIVSDILSIVRFEHVFEFYETPEQALVSFRF